jgi:hypothetical protein
MTNTENPRVGSSILSLGTTGNKAPTLPTVGAFSLRGTRQAQTLSCPASNFSSAED